MVIYIGEKMNKIKGILYVSLAAILFGVTPLFASESYKLGNNGLNMVLLRNTLVIPILFGIISIKKISFKINSADIKNLIIITIFGSATTTMLLYSSYKYISVGIATAFHFIYPVIVSIFLTIFFKNNMSKLKVLSLIVSVIGVFSFIEIGGQNEPVGYLMAILSGFTYAFYLTFMEKSKLVKYNPLVISFWIACITSAILIIMNIKLNFIVLQFENNITWVYIILVSLLTSFVGLVLFITGIKNIGAGFSSVLTLLEPFTSIVVGIVFQNDKLTIFKLIGFMLIVSSILLTTYDNKTRTQNKIIE